MTVDELATRDLSDVYRSWFAALPVHDFAFFERTLADEWTYTDIDGVVRGKAEYLEVVSLVQPNHRSGLVELQAHTYGDIAVAFGAYKVIGVLASGKDVSSFTRFTAVWRRTDAGWTGLAHHATRVAGA